MGRLLTIDPGGTAEEAAQRRIAESLPDGWILTTNVHERRFEVVRIRTEIDCILISPLGVFTIDLKNVSGPITPMIEGPWRGLNDRTNPYIQGRKQWTALARLIQKKTDVKIFVDYIIAFTHRSAHIVWSGSDVEEGTDSRHRVVLSAGVESAVRKLSRQSIDVGDARKVIRALTSHVPDDLFDEWPARRPEYGRSKKTNFERVEQTREEVGVDEYSVAVTREQAVNGGKIRVKIETRILQITIPAGIADGTRMRLRRAIGGKDVYLRIVIEDRTAPDDLGESGQQPGNSLGWVAAVLLIALGLVVWIFESPVLIKTPELPPTNAPQNEPPPKNSAPPPQIPSIPPDTHYPPVVNNTFDFKVCNGNDFFIYVAVMGRPTYEPNSWIIKGWRQVARGSCTLIGSFIKGGFYAVAEGNNLHWGNQDLRVCVSAEAFERRRGSTRICGSNERSVGFQRFNIFTNEWSWNLGMMPAEAPFARSSPAGTWGPIGRPVELGRPVDAGIPIAPGVPSAVGRPSYPGRPMSVGRPVTSGRPIDVGRPW
jgi:uncharacterized membrane protein